MTRSSLGGFLRTERRLIGAATQPGLAGSEHDWVINDRIAGSLTPIDLGLAAPGDDDPSIVRALQWLLQRDFEVLTTTSAQEAIELVQANDFDVVTVPPRS